MKLPHSSFQGFLIYVVLVVAVLILLFLPEESHEVKDAVSAVGQHMCQQVAIWLTDSASRAWLILASVGLATLYFCREVSIRKRIIDIERRLQWLELGRSLASESVRLDVVDPVPAPLSATVPRPALMQPKNGTPIVTPERPATVDEVPEPAHQLARFLEATRRCKHLRVKPEVPTRPWLMGFACNKGNVRPQNQDYGFCFLLGDRQVLVLADGCGGTPHGQRAAYLAVVEAACSIAKAYGGASWYSCDAQLVAQQALLDASARLAKEGAKMHLANPGDGLRTTLIVLIGQGSDVAYAYIGDGGGCIVRTSGAVEQFLTPQKASPDQPNVLAASLGPQIQGEPVVGSIQRHPGDILLIGTDGVFDRVEESFPKDVLRAGIQFKGDLRTAAERILEDLASKQDELGFICDDNLTLGIMGDGSAPVLAAGFWTAQKIPETEDNGLRIEGTSHVESR